ncbi:methyltransferase domain-containing protein [Rheinheimera mangrovi]|uniref:methyltransferase domain-containing protein n=1 Tax=Rheinheimera mangrovi TaxID=2498451 RepID=UPI0013E0BAB2|nr:methyltransferase domain-containing protein [Rheinheimera mangrovi]
MKDFSVCPVCNHQLLKIENKFCEIRSKLIYNELDFKQYLCPHCKHSCTYHNVPLELIYSAESALPTDRQFGDLRLDFIKKHLDLVSVNGMAIEIGGGPGELAEMLRSECTHEKALVVDFVDRVAFENLNFVYSDLNNSDESLIRSLDKYKINNKKNVFLLSHVLEHIFNPIDILRELKKFDQSYFFIEVPDFGSYHDSSVLRYSINCPDHIHYFNSNSFISLIQDAGLNIIAFERQSTPYVPALRILCDASDQRNAVLDYASHLKSISSQIEALFREYSSEGNIYLFGLTPFAAQAIISYVNQDRSIKGIFDTKYSLESFSGIPVFKDPLFYQFPDNEVPIFICGSTFFAVQQVMRERLKNISPHYDLKTVTISEK